MESYLASFSRSAAKLRPTLDARHIEAHVGRWHESAVLKLQKRRWAHPHPAPGAGEAGVFFSVWINEKSLRHQRMCYNIHALQLRSLKGVSIQSREFAAAFRSAFAGSSGDWPHVSTDYGPQTLMEGWVDLVSDKMETDVDALIRGFLPLADVIDHLLDQRTS